MALLRRLYGPLRLKVNETQSAMANVFGRKFPGYSLWVAPGGVVKRKVAANSRRCWRNSGQLLNSVLNLVYFDQLGVPRLS